MRYSKNFLFAIHFVNELHAEQNRKSGNALYLSHLLSVAAMVMESGGDEDTVIAALLHDSIEDQNYLMLRNDIACFFGQKVLNIVEELTETDEDPKPPWKERKLKYLNHLEKASPEAKLIALADKVHNARATVFDLRREGVVAWEKFNAPREEQLWWYQQLLQALSYYMITDLGQELYRLYCEMKEYN